MKNLQVEVAFIAAEKQFEVEKAFDFMSDEKKALNIKNKIARLRTIKVYSNASEKALTFIVEHSSDLVLEELFNYKCMKTALRILNYAKYATDESSNAFANANADTKTLLTALKRAQLKKMSALEMSYLMTSDSRRDNKTLKCAQFYNLIKIENKTFRDEIRKENTIEILV